MENSLHIYASNQEIYVSDSPQTHAVVWIYNRQLQGIRVEFQVKAFSSNSGEKNELYFSNDILHHEAFIVINIIIGNL